jgi:hypothetical protein
VGLFRRKATRDLEPGAEANPRSQAHPIPVEPSLTAAVDAERETLAIREPVSLAVVPSPATHAESAAEQPYDRLDCPACGTIFRDLPDALADCPACGSTIHVLTCPEGIRHLLTAADGAAFDDDWDAVHMTRQREEAQRRNAAALESRRSALASYVELGVRLVELRPLPGACAACLTAAGRPYRPRAAPGLPITGCAHDICRCEFAPARPRASRR